MTLRSDDALAVGICRAKFPQFGTQTLRAARGDVNWSLPAAVVTPIASLRCAPEDQHPSLTNALLIQQIIARAFKRASAPSLSTSSVLVGAQAVTNPMAPMAPKPG